MFPNNKEAVIFDHFRQDARFQGARSGDELSRLVWCAMEGARQVEARKRQTQPTKAKRTDSRGVFKMPAWVPRPW
jgi:hypothetical protein